MYQIQVTVPEGIGKSVAELALGLGVKQASVQSAFVYGSNSNSQQVSLQISTPVARALVEKIMCATWFDPAQCSVALTRLHGLISSSERQETTVPGRQPALRVFEDLWQLNHTNLTYYVRALVAACVLAYGMRTDGLITVVVALLFVSFLSEALAIGFGIWARDLPLALQGLKAFAVSTVLTIAGGVIVAILPNPPMLFHEYNTLLSGFLISLIIGFAAGTMQPDDSGMQFLIGVAAAAQVSFYPVWFGWSLVRGFPDYHLSTIRITAFFLNMAAMCAMGLAGYLAVGVKRREITRLVEHREI